MGRRLAEPAEVARRAHDAVTEMMLPDAIDHHAGGQRVVACAIHRASSSRPLPRVIGAGGVAEELGDGAERAQARVAAADVHGTSWIPGNSSRCAAFLDRQGKRRGRKQLFVQGVLPCDSPSLPMRPSRVGAAGDRRRLEALPVASSPLGCSDCRWRFSGRLRRRGQRHRCTTMPPTSARTRVL